MNDTRTYTIETTTKIENVPEEFADYRSYTQFPGGPDLLTPQLMEKAKAMALDLLQRDIERHELVDAVVGDTEVRVITYPPIIAGESE